MFFRRLTLLLAVLLTLAACSGGEEKPAKDIGDQQKIQLLNPFTGETDKGPAPENPVFLVKVDNTPPSAPQTSIDRAEMVIEQAVEAGVTRLAVFYWRDIPESMGHIRSTRATDIGIVKPVSAHIVASGGAGVTLRRIKAADIQIHTEDDGAPGFSSDVGGRPYNRLLDLTAIAGGTKASGTLKPYFNWAKKSGEKSEVTASSAAVRFSGYHTTLWAFNGKTWSRTNGTSQPEFESKNLIVMHADERDAGYLDPGGNRVPETVFTGEGDFTLFAGNQVFEGTWSKKDLDSTIKLTDKTGKELKMPTGKTWIELVNKGQGQVTWQ